MPALRIEPRTSRLWDECSTTELWRLTRNSSYSWTWCRFHAKLLSIDGTRTRLSLNLWGVHFLLRKLAKVVCQFWLPAALYSVFFFFSILFILMHFAFTVIHSLFGFWSHIFDIRWHTASPLGNYVHNSTQVVFLLWFLRGTQTWLLEHNLRRILLERHWDVLHCGWLFVPLSFRLNPWDQETFCAEFHPGCSLFQTRNLLPLPVHWQTSPHSCTQLVHAECFLWQKHPFPQQTCPEQQCFPSLVQQFLLAFLESNTCLEKWKRNS